jgi:hypothetical protein
MSYGMNYGRYVKFAAGMCYSEEICADAIVAYLNLLRCRMHFDWTKINPKEKVRCDPNDLKNL